MVINGISVGFGLLGILFVLSYALFCFLMAEATLIHTFKGELPQEMQNPSAPQDQGSVRGVEDALSFLLKANRVKYLKPKVVITPEITKQARVARRLGGGGVVLLSRGLTEVVSDRELIRILNLAVETLNSGQVTAQSALSTVWIHLSPLYREAHTPLRAITSWGLLPIERFLNRRHEKLDILMQLSTQSPEK